MKKIDGVWTLGTWTLETQPPKSLVPDEEELPEVAEEDDFHVSDVDPKDLEIEDPAASLQPMTMSEMAGFRPGVHPKGDCSASHCCSVARSFGIMEELEGVEELMEPHPSNLVAIQLPEAGFLPTAGFAPTDACGAGPCFMSARQRGAPIVWNMLEEVFFVPNLDGSAAGPGTRRAYGI